MPPAYLLDTSVFSQPVKDRPVQSALNRWHTTEAIGHATCTSAICVAEILQGLHVRQSARYWKRYKELIEHRYPVLPFDSVVAETYGELSATMKRQGRTRPVLDLMIAATAKTHGLVVATLNLEDFRDIPGVAVEDWS